MVVTKVIQIKGVASLGRSTKYIEDEAKTVEMTETKSLNNALRYIENLSKTSFLEQDEHLEFPAVVKDGRVVKQLVSTYGITDASTATEEFLLTKKNAAQRAGTKELNDIQNPNRVLAHHIIQSFSPEDDLSPQEIHEIGRKTILELTGGQHEFVIATHMDKGHIHNHIIFNSTNSVTLNKFRWQKGTKKSLENISDKYADLAGAKILKERLWTNRKTYHAYRKKNSFRYEIKSRLDFLLKHSTSLEDFKTKALALNLVVDTSGKEIKYRLTDQEQTRNIRDRTLSKKGNYSLEKISERVVANEVTFSVDEIKSEYEKMVAEREDDFEMRITVEEWQVMEETKNGIYLEMEFGIRNKGTILIPAHQIEKSEDGSYEIFIRKNDFYYFVNPKHADKNRYMKGETVASQLSYDNGEMIVRKNPKISSLDQLVREYNYLSAHGVTEGQQFDELLNRFEEELEEVDNLLDKLDQRLGELNKIQSAFLALESSDPQEVKLAIAIMKDLRVDPSTRKSEIDKLVKEATFERQALYQRVEAITKDYKLHQDIEKNVKQRKERETSL